MCFYLTVQLKFDYGEVGFAMVLFVPPDFLTVVFIFFMKFGVILLKSERL